MAFYSKIEERWNTWSHAGGILLGVTIGIIFIIMCVRHSSHLATWGVSLYLFGMLGSYICSTAYHALPPDTRIKARLRRWDHAAIYWHIAGSYSPLTLVAMWQQGYWGLALFIFVWACAIVGTVMSFVALKEHSHLETFCFVGMGLSVLVAFKPLLDGAGAIATSWVVAEGVCYITGAVFYSLRRRFMHAVFHFFVLAGSMCHIVAVWNVLMQTFYN